MASFPVSKENADTYLNMWYLSLSLSQYVNWIQLPGESILVVLSLVLFLILVQLLFKTQSSLFPFAITF